MVASTRPKQIAQARAQLAELEAQLREMQIVAPTNCVLEVLHMRLGDVLAPNREVATVLFPDRTYARVHVPEWWLERIRVGDKVKPIFYTSILYPSDFEHVTKTQIGLWHYILPLALNCGSDR